MITFVGVYFLLKERKNIKFNICRINKKAQIIQNLLDIVFHKAYKASPDSTDHKIVHILKGVWDEIYLRGR